MLSKMNLLARRSVPRTASACRSFHVSAPSQNDKESASDDMVTHPPNEGVLGTLFGNPYYSVPICGLGIMTATATDVSIYTIQSKSSLYISRKDVIKAIESVLFQTRQNFKKYIRGFLRAFNFKNKEEQTLVQDS